MPPPRSVTLRLALSSILSAMAVAAVCAVGLVSLRDLSRFTRDAVMAQIGFMDEASVFEQLLYQKGFVADYVLTRNRTWLDRLAQSRSDLQSRLARTRASAASAEARKLLDQLEAEYRAYDRERDQVILLFDVGDTAQAQSLLERLHAHVEKLRSLAVKLEREGRAALAQRLTTSGQSIHRLAVLLLGTSIGGALFSLLAGFYLARRVGKPIYELQLRVESAAQRIRLRVDPGTDDLDTLGEQVGALIGKLEEADQTLVEQRKRLIQSEKLSAMGEMAAKVAHEILNPLAGLKLAIQRLGKKGVDADIPGREAVEMSDLVSAEIARVEDLVRRLMDYARPLAPRTEVCSIAHLFGAALDATSSELATRGAKVVPRIAEDLPPLEVDLRLMTQALTNLLLNAAQAMPSGGSIEVSACRAQDHGKESVRIEVADSGAGIPEADMGKLFQPFFTTKAKGHGLGLAMSQNILLEHGGRIAACNRTDRAGAVFEIWLPIVR